MTTGPDPPGASTPKSCWNLPAAETPLHYGTLAPVLPILLPCHFFLFFSIIFPPPTWVERLSQLFQLLCYTTLNIIKANKARLAGSIVIWHWKLKILNEQCLSWCHTQGVWGGGGGDKAVDFTQLGFSLPLENFREVLIGWDGMKLWFWLYISLDIFLKCSLLRQISPGIPWIINADLPAIVLIQGPG